MGKTILPAAVDKIEVEQQKRSAKSALLIQLSPAEKKPFPLCEELLFNKNKLMKRREA